MKNNHDRNGRGSARRSEKKETERGRKRRKEKRRREKKKIIDGKVCWNFPSVKRFETPLMTIEPFIRADATEPTERVNFNLPLYSNASV